MSPVEKPLAAPRSARAGAAPRAAVALSRGLPHSAEAEISVLGSMILNNDTIDVVVPVLSGDAFYSVAHQEIYQAIASMHAEHRAVDLMTLRDELERRGTFDKVGGVEYVSSLLDGVPAAANAEYYAEIVRDKAIFRDLVAASQEIVEDVGRGEIRSRELLDRVQATIFKIAERGAHSSVSEMKDLLKVVFERIDSARDRKGMLTGLATGFHDLDEITSGLQSGELVIIAGRPSMGKTSFALNVIEHVGVRLHKAAALFSLEMSREQVARNMLCSHARIDSHRLRRAGLSANELENLPLHVGALSEAPIFIDDTPSLNTFELRAKVRRLKAREGLALAVVDYLQLMEGPHVENRQQQIASISRSVKGLAREMNIPVIAVSQLNRQVESRDDHRPRMADLRESGALEQDADVVMLLHRPGYYPGADSEDNTAELIVAKQRNGPTGKVNLSFLRQFMRFESSTEGMREY